MANFLSKPYTTAPLEIVGRKLLSYFHTIILTQGSDEVLVFARDIDSNFMSLPVPPVDTIVNVTGAGDSLNAGIIAGLINGHCLKDSVEMGIRVAQHTLKSQRAVGENVGEAVAAER